MREPVPTSSVPRITARRGVASLWGLALGGLLAACGGRASAPAVRPDAPAAQAASLEKELRQRSAEVLEAIRLGDKERMARYLAPGAKLINRDGKEYTSEEFLADLVPPREGYDLRFTLLESRVFDRGDSALFTFLLDEYLTIFGQDVSTAYRNHFLFHRIDGQWKLALYTYWEVPSTPPPLSLPVESLDKLTGTYELAPGKWVTRITREGERLYLQREGGSRRELVPTTGERFHIAGLEAEYFFEAATGGRPQALVFRRNWKDLRFQRVQGT